MIIPNMGLKKRLFCALIFNITYLGTNGQVFFATPVILNPVCIPHFKRAGGAEGAGGEKPHGNKGVLKGGFSIITISERRSGGVGELLAQGGVAQFGRREN